MSTVYGIRSGPFALLMFTYVNNVWTTLASIVKGGILGRLYGTVGTGTLAFPVSLKSSLSIVESVSLSSRSGMRDRMVILSMCFYGRRNCMSFGH